jgi:murein DD-endopeptidase MepM/ murein hydrolase activator NlpD
MHKQYYWVVGLILLAVFVFGLIYHANHKTVTGTPKLTNPGNRDTESSPPPAPVAAKPQVVNPIAQANDRVTKKPFGIYITPKTSPVQPEKFTGYHTGTDFETFANEANTDVPFNAICEGKILQKRTATGYGGILVQACTINNQAVTIVYGHIKLSSISKNVGDSFSQGEKIGFLGQPPTETDGERKHLHLGIHIGTTPNVAGYVQKQSDLSAWLDFQKL